MAIISRLAVLLGLDAGEFNAGLGNAKSKVESFSAGAKLGLAGVATAFVAATKEAIDFADRITDVAKANEMSVASVLRMSQALAINGGDADSAGRLMASFNQKIDEAAKGSKDAHAAFTRMGVSIKDLKTLSPQELFEKVVKQLGAIEDPVKRNAIAMEMFGKAIKGVDIKGLSEDMQKSKGQFEEAEVAFKRINASMDKFAVAWLKLKVSLAQTFAGLLEAQANYIDQSEAKQKRFDQIAKRYGFQAAFLDKIGSKKIDFSEPEFGSVQGAIAPKIMSGIGGVAADKKDVRDVIAANADTIQKQKEFYEKEMQISQAKLGRIEKEHELESLGEAERKRILDIYDINQKMLQLDVEKKMTKDQINKWGDLEKARVEEEYRIAKSQQSFEYGWKKAFKTYADDANNAAKQAEQAFVNLTQSLEDTLTTFFETGKLNFKSFASAIIHEIARMQAQAAAKSIMGLFGGGGGGGIGSFISSLFGGGGGAGMFTGSTGEIGGSILHSAGGNELGAGQPSLIGENGPEMFIPKSAGTIVPNNRIGSMMGNQPQVVYNGPYIANMQAIDTQSGLQFLAKNKQGVWAANQSAQRSLPQSR
jgi:lambda family phage tail tape measure protein